jgi:hypothetical protein
MFSFIIKKSWLMPYDKDAYRWALHRLSFYKYVFIYFYNEKFKYVFNL